jgi:hypothetical protein
MKESNEPIKPFFTQTPEDEKIVEENLKKSALPEKMKKFFKWTGGITGASLLLWYANYERTHTNIDTELVPIEESDTTETRGDTAGNKQTATIIQGEDGKLYEVIYKHPDNETTLVLDYLAGKTELSTQFLFERLRDTVLKDWLRDMSIPYPENSDTWSMEQWSEYLQKSHTDFKNYNLRNQMDSMWLDRKLDIDASFYELWWGLENECGNPKISLSFQPMFMHIQTEGSYYHPGENTIYLSIKELYRTENPDNILKVFAYAKYFNEHPLKRQLGAIGDATMYGFKNNWDIDSMGEHFNNDFAKEMETFEKAVVSEILPDLKSKYYGIAGLFVPVQGQYLTIPNIAFVPDQSKEKVKKELEEVKNEIKDLEAY